MRYLFKFCHYRAGKDRNQTEWAEFGPYETPQEAAEAFQRVYGYWPGAWTKRPYRQPS